MGRATFYEIIKEGNDTKNLLSISDETNMEGDDESEYFQGI